MKSIKLFIHLKRCLVSIIPPEPFLGKTILQGSVATRLRCGGIVSNHSTTNSLQNPSGKEFRKSVKIRQSYHKKFNAPFLGHSVYLKQITLVYFTLTFYSHKNFICT